MELDELVNLFGETKSEADKYKKEAETYNSDIKKIMSETELSEFSTEKYKVKLSTIESKSFDEPKLLDKLKELGITECIRTVEVVDMTNLENAIYNGKLDASKLKDCQIVTTQQRLTISKVKEKKNG